MNRLQELSKRLLQSPTRREQGDWLGDLLELRVRLLRLNRRLASRVASEKAEPEVERP